MNLNQEAINLYEEKGHEEAFDVFREAVRVSRDVQSLNNLGWMLMHEKRDYPAAFDLSEEAVAMKPDSHFPYSILGEVCLHLKKWEKARDALEKAIALQPTKTDYHNIGVAHYHLGNIEDAARFFLLGSEPSDCSLYCHIKCLIELGNVEQAKQLLTTFSAQDEEFAGEVDVADLYLELGCYHEAVQWYENGWNAWWKEPNWVSRFAFSLAKVANLDRGREILEEVIRERAEQLEEIINEELDDWDEEDRQWYIADTTSEKRAFESLHMNFPPDRLPQMDFLTQIKTDCYLFGCGRHGHPEYHTKE